MNILQSNLRPNPIILVYKILCYKIIDKKNIYFLIFIILDALKEKLHSIPLKQFLIHYCNSGSREIFTVFHLKYNTMQWNSGQLLLHLLNKSYQKEDIFLQQYELIN